MSDESLLRDMARVAREQEAEEGPWLDERWERLFAGDLPPEEEAALAALAVGSEEALETFEAFRPLGPDFAARAVERWERLFAGDLPPEEEAALATLAAESEEALETFEAFRPLRPDIAAGAVEAIEQQQTAPEPAGPVRKARFGRRRMRGAKGWMAAVAAIAAALVVMMRSPGQLPEYTADLPSGGQGVRGTSEPVQRQIPAFSPGDHFKVTASPTKISVSGPVDAVCLLKGEDGEPFVWMAAPLSTEGGFVSLEGKVGEKIRLPSGRYRLWIAVARKGKLPAAAELLRLLGGPSLPTKGRVIFPRDLPMDFRIQ